MGYDWYYVARRRPICCSVINLNQGFYGQLVSQGRALVSIHWQTGSAAGMELILSVGYAATNTRWSRPSLTSAARQLRSTRPGRLQGPHNPFGRLPLTIVAVAVTAEWRGDRLPPVPAGLLARVTGRNAAWWTEVPAVLTRPRQPAGSGGPRRPGASATSRPARPRCRVARYGSIVRPGGPGQLLREPGRRAD